ncbi:MAG: DUF1738 domain-containing protein [Planctomycetota bacterium]|jgi:hypothetical protein
MKPNLVRKVSEQAFSELVEAVEAGKSQKLVEYLKAMGRFHQYSLGNTILISFQKPNAMHVAGFRTWQKLGRAVAFKTAYVFDVSQTDGKPLPEFARVNGDPGVYTERLREYISSRGVKLKYSDAIGSAEGLSAGGLIMLKKGLTAAEEFSVLIHEAAHEILHRDKENRPKEKKTRETEAEAVAFVVCHGVGLDTNTASSDYIQLYNGDKETLVKSLERIQRTASEILEAVMDKGSGCKASGGEPCVAVAA